MTEYVLIGCMDEEYGVYPCDQCALQGTLKCEAMRTAEGYTPVYKEVG
jgi:hypothetical protein